CVSQYRVGRRSRGGGAGRGRSGLRRRRRTGLPGARGLFVAALLLNGVLAQLTLFGEEPPVYNLEALVLLGVGHLVALSVCQTRSQNSNIRVHTPQAGGRKGKPQLRLLAAPCKLTCHQRKRATLSCCDGEGIPANDK